MKLDKTLDDLPEEQKKLGVRVFDLTIDRVLKRIYSSFDGKTQKEMNVVFSSESDDKKEKFIKTHIPNFVAMFKEEAAKIEEEIKKDIKGQFQVENSE